MADGELRAEPCGGVGLGRPVHGDEDATRGTAAGGDAARAIRTDVGASRQHVEPGPAVGHDDQVVARDAGQHAGRLVGRLGDVGPGLHGVLGCQPVADHEGLDLLGLRARPPRGPVWGDAHEVDRRARPGQDGRLADGLGSFRVRPVRQRIRSNGGVRVEEGSLAVALMTRTYGVAQRL